MAGRAARQTKAHTRATGSVRSTALPQDWDDLWSLNGSSSAADDHFEELRTVSAKLAAQLQLKDATDAFAGLVGANDLQDYPVHRWFSYKEGFSPRLPAAVLDELGWDSKGAVVADVFGGVATTAVALREDPRVGEIRSLEYSPLAHSVGAVKLNWPLLNPQRLTSHLRALLRYRVDARMTPPALATFRNGLVFRPSDVTSLQSAVRAIQSLPGASPIERAFLGVGVAAVVEDASSAIKDGRALRIVRSGRRKSKSLVPMRSPVSAVRDRVKVLLQNQVLAMIEDLEDIADRRARTESTSAWHVRGDARCLSAVLLPDGTRAFPAESIDTAIYSPPYLNFIDYTEVYKLELWLLGHVTSHPEFRRLREGSLRSHPSLRFAERPSANADDHAAVALAHRLADWLSAHGRRPNDGIIVRQYFEDMYASLAEQFRALRPGGIVACVVANSTFSRRDSSTDEAGICEETWRVPVLTDVMIAHLGLLCGFESAELWHARYLRPRNVRSGTARESIVVLQKPNSA